jgi:hypothetical protein
MLAQVQATGSLSFELSQPEKRLRRKGNSMKKTQPTEDQKMQLAALDAIHDADIDLI